MSDTTDSWKSNRSQPRPSRPRRTTNGRVPKNAVPQANASRDRGSHSSPPSTSHDSGAQSKPAATPNTKGHGRSKSAPQVKATLASPESAMSSDFSSSNVDLQQSPSRKTKTPEKKPTSVHLKSITKSGGRAKDNVRDTCGDEKSNRQVKFNEGSSDTSSDFWKQGYNKHVRNTSASAIPPKSTLSKAQQPNARPTQTPKSKRPDLCGAPPSMFPFGEEKEYKRLLSESSPRKSSMAPRSQFFQGDQTRPSSTSPFKAQSNEEHHKMVMQQSMSCGSKALKGKAHVPSARIDPVMSRVTNTRTTTATTNATVVSSNITPDASSATSARITAANLAATQQMSDRQASYADVPVGWICFILFTFVAVLIVVLMVTTRLKKSTATHISVTEIDETQLQLHVLGLLAINIVAVLLYGSFLEVTRCLNGRRERAVVMDEERSYGTF